VGVVIDTELGVIEIEVEVEKAPLTARNFLRYVDERHYDGGQFHRTVTMDNQPASPVPIEVRPLSSGWHGLDGAGRSRHRDLELLHLYRRSA
jgi:Cyclophilin type peptidyl-prolyl cis-trans isomerase/CLD